MILRPYQEETHEKLRYWYNKGYNRLLVHMATGLGKTSGVALHLPKTFPELAKEGVLFLAHRREILFQAYEKFDEYYPNKWGGLEMGEHHATGMEDYVFASVDSIGRLMSKRIENYNRRRFGVVITDEGHHASKDSIWDNILNYFGVGSDPTSRYTLDNGQKPLSVFLTATPERSDGQPLTPFVDAVDTPTGAAVSYDILYGIRNGWLTDIRSYQVYNEEYDIQNLQLEQQVDYLIKTYQKYAEGKRTLAFARSVAQSQLLADTLNKHGITQAAHIDANTDKDDRDVLVPRFFDGDIMFMSNRLVFTEGYDNPNIEAILDNGPTESTPLHIQKLGRGLRPHASVNIDQYKTAEERRRAIHNSPKPYLLYIATFDPTVHGLDIAATVWGKGKSVDAEGSLVVEEVIDVIERIEEEQPERPTRDIWSLSEAKVSLKKADVWNRTVYNEELRALTDLRWVLTDDWAALYLPNNPTPKTPYEDTPLIIRWVKKRNVWNFEKIVVGGWVEALNKPVRHKRKRSDVMAQDLHNGIKKVDKWLRVNFPDVYDSMRRGMNDPATEEQIKYMKNHGIKFGDSVSEGTAELLKDNFRINRKLEQLNIK